MNAAVERREIDRRIWDEELEDFVPARVFDAHTHLYQWAHTTNPSEEPPGWRRSFGVKYPFVDWGTLEATDRALMPGRTVHRLAMGVPFVHCDFDAANAHTAAEAARDPASGAIMLVHPSMAPERVEAAVERRGFVGLKPYRLHSVTGDRADCRIADFLPESQIAVADRHGLLVMLHLSKRGAAADAENLDDLERLTARYPNVQWNLCHCARCYYDAPLRKAADRLRAMPNLWYDISSVCDADAMDALLDIAGPDRVMYGSDDMPAGVARGKYIHFGHAWAALNESNHDLSLSHCDPAMTFVRYEMLRAFHRATRRQGYGEREIERLFHGNASRLLGKVRAKRRSVPSDATG